ncbi:PPM-type phosphatase domain [Trinorchestia longiramus]|nr:PPM-type phosphatase domain [Trinorchestia longiramus]
MQRVSSAQRLKGGTTAVVALLREKRLAVAWLGDSLAVLVRKRQPVKLVEPHKPDLQSERDRVNNMGGVVMQLEGSWRILGQLAVSRAIGDADYKPFISSECDIKSLEIVGDEDFLILATDGLWDTLSYEEAVSFVYAYLTINQGQFSSCSSASLSGSCSPVLPWPQHPRVHQYSYPAASTSYEFSLLF